MIIKKNQYIISMVTFMIAFVCVFIVSLSYFLGFSINSLSISIYFLIILGISLISILVCIFFSLCIKTYYEINDDVITLYKNGCTIEKYDVKEIEKAEYRRFSFGTIFEQGTFGYIKISFKDKTIIYFDVSFRKVKKINNYFKVFIFK